MTPKKLLIGLGLVVVLGAIAYANFHFKQTTGAAVTVEKATRRDLEAIVSASGTIQPKRSVNISADTMGRVVDLAVTEGETVKKGQFLLQIDPRTLQTQVQNQEASLVAARSALEETRRSLESARASLALSEQQFKRQDGLYKQGLVSKDAFESTQSELKVRQAAVAQGEQSLKTQEARISQQEAMLESAQYDLTKVRITSPIDGIITKRNIEEGETAVVGTMNNAGTNLLTVADMSIIQAEIEVDETDIPNVQLGQKAKISIDAVPDQTFSGTVTEVGNSPIQATGSTSTTGRATNFKVVVTVDGTVPAVRPGFTCTASITTATREQALSVPIQAMTVRELVVDASGAVVSQPPAPKTASKTDAAPVELKPGQSRKEFDGVFVDRNDHAVFVPVKTGIAGDKYFEVLNGLKEGDQIITGPFNSVRSLKEGDEVKISTSPAAAPKS